MDCDTVFYDGTCGLCHRAVRFLLAEDPEGRHFCFAPLQGETFTALVGASERLTLPDSMVVQTAEGKLLTRSAAVLHLLRRLGGIWRAAARIAGLLPVAWLDLIYDGVARTRSRLFARPPDACPVLPRELRERFLP